MKEITKSKANLTILKIYKFLQISNEANSWKRGSLSRINKKEKEIKMNSEIKRKFSEI